MHKSRSLAKTELVEMKDFSGFKNLKYLKLTGLPLVNPGPVEYLYGELYKSSVVAKNKYI